MCTPERRADPTISMPYQDFMEKDTEPASHASASVPCGNSFPGLVRHADPSISYGRVLEWFDTSLKTEAESVRSMKL
jgi:hypothetical protein